MKPSITRETIVDRRQPALRWSAVFAGAVISIALWVLLQMVGMGVGLAAIDLDDSGSLRTVGIGTTVWTLAAPVIAMFVGGLVAGRLATTFDRWTAACHGFVVWALTGVLGMVATAGIVSLLARTGAFMPVPAAVENTSMTNAQLAEAADTTSKVLLGAGLSLLISLVAAVLGGSAGKRRIAREVAVVTPMPPPVAPTTPTSTTIVT